MLPAKFPRKSSRAAASVPGRHAASGDRHSVLNTVSYFDPDWSPVMKINTESGETTLIGYTHQVYKHGGDILPKMVKVAHRNCCTIGSHKYQVREHLHG